MIEEIRIIIVLPHIVVPMPGFHESEEETFGRRFRPGRETRAEHDPRRTKPNKIGVHRDTALRIPASILPQRPDGL